MREDSSAVRLTHGVKRTRKRPTLRAALAALTVGATIIGVTAGPAAAQTPDRPWMQRTLSPDQRAGLLLNAMTLDEKVELMSSNHGAAPVGYYNGPIARLGIRELRMGDAASGISSRGWTVPGTGDRATSFPSLAAVGATWDPATARQQGKAVGIEARRTAHDMVLGPNADLVRSPWWGRIAETFSEDPKLTSSLVVPM